MLVHARKTSPGVGHASNNSNNHPFVSEDRRIGVIHNGKIHEASFLTKKYETQTDCDSEIILRMYENGIYEAPVDVKETPLYLQQRLPGLQELWSVMREGSCASMIGELHEDGSRSLIVFRNEKRPLWVADLREVLGQIFFFSSVEIWFKALKDFKYKSLIFNTKIAEIPDGEIWSFKIDKDNSIVNSTNFFRLKIEKDFANSKNWIDPEKKKSIYNKKMNLSIVTDLDAKGNPPAKVTTNYASSYYNNKTSNPPYSGYTGSKSDWVNYRDNVNKPVVETKALTTTIKVESDDPTVHEIPKIESFNKISEDEKKVITETLVIENDLICGDGDCGDDEDTIIDEEYLTLNDEFSLENGVSDVEELCAMINEMVSDIAVDIYNKSCEGSLTLADLSDLVQNLEEVKQNLEGSKEIIKHL